MMSLINLPTLIYGWCTERLAEGVTQWDFPALGAYAMNSKQSFYRPRVEADQLKLFREIDL